MSAANTSQTGAHAGSETQAGARGQPIKGRRALDSLDLGARTTGEKAAARSQLIKRLRLIFPLFALVLVIVFVFASQSNNVDQEAFLQDFENIAAANEELRMANPRFAGVDDKGNPFEITALAAKQDPSLEDVVELERPRAVQGADDAQTIVTADNGVYQSETNVLELTEKVRLEHELADDKYVLTAPNATVLIKEEIVTVNTGVNGEGPGGDALKADTMKAYNGEGRIVFEGNVSMRIYPKSDEETDTLTIAPPERL